MGKGTALLSINCSGIYNYTVPRPRLGTLLYCSLYCYHCIRPLLPTRTERMPRRGRAGASYNFTPYFFCITPCVSLVLIYHSKMFLSLK